VYRTAALAAEGRHPHVDAEEVPRADAEFPSGEGVEGVALVEARGAPDAVAAAVAGAEEGGRREGVEAITERALQRELQAEILARPRIHERRSERPVLPEVEEGERAVGDHGHVEEALHVALEPDARGLAQRPLVARDGVVRPREAEVSVGLRAAPGLNEVEAEVLD